MSKTVTIFPSIQRLVVVDCVVGIPDYINPVKNSNSVICHALIDTGAMISAISKRVVDYLKIPGSGSQEVIAANNHHDIVDTYVVNIDLDKDVRFNMVQMSELDMEGYDIIIGMDLLSNGNLVITNTDGRTIFMFEQIE